MARTKTKTKRKTTRTKLAGTVNLSGAEKLAPPAPALSPADIELVLTSYGRDYMAQQKSKAETYARERAAKALACAIEGREADAYLSSYRAPKKENVTLARRILFALRQYDNELAAIDREYADYGV